MTIEGVAKKTKKLLAAGGSHPADPSYPGYGWGVDDRT